MTRIVKVFLLIAYLRIASAVLPTDEVGIVGFCDEMTNSNLQLLTTPSSPFERIGGVVSLTVSLPDMNDETGISTVSVGLNCESKPSSTCGNGLKCYRCGNSKGFDGHFVVNKETGFLIGVLSNAIDDTKFEIRTDGKARDVQSQFRYRGVWMKDLTILFDGISVPNEGRIPVTVGPNDRRSAVREAYAPVRSSEALPTKRTNVDRVGRALSPASDDGSVVDLLYFFSHRAACQWLEKEYPYTLEADDQSTLETLVGEINTYGNTALSNSEIPTSFNVVKVHVDLTYNEGTFISLDDRLDWVTESVVARNLRDEYKADLVVGVFYTDFQGAKGIGYIPTIFPNKAAGYSSSGGLFLSLDETITHEIGHNFGANHDRYNAENSVADESFYGHINCNECFRTIMSYTNECVDLGKCNSVERIPYFSNPDLEHKGFSMGDNVTNNVLQLTRSAPGVAINQYSYGESIFSTSNSIFTDAQLMAVKFDIVPKKNLILKNIELEVSTDMKISVYIVTGRYANVTDWGIPIVTETLTPPSKLNSKLRNVASYVFFPDKSLDADQVYAVRIERQDNDTNYMTIAELQDEGDYFENNDVTVKSGAFIDFNGKEYPNIAGLKGGLIYDYAPSEVPSGSPSTSPSSGPSKSPSRSPSVDPSGPPSSSPSSEPSSAPSINPSARPSESPSAKPSISSSESPSAVPSASPSAAPSASPSATPSASPSAAPSASPSAAPSTSPSASPSATPSAAPSATPNADLTTSPSASPVEVTCKDNSKVVFKVPNKKGKIKKKKKCNKIKEKHCDTEYNFKKKVDGLKKGKPKDFCQETCYPKQCCKDGTDKDYKIKTKKGQKVKGTFSCKKIEKKDYCKGTLQTGEKLKDVCKNSCDGC